MDIKNLKKYKEYDLDTKDSKNRELIYIPKSIAKEFI